MLTNKQRNEETNRQTDKYGSKYYPGQPVAEVIKNMFWQHEVRQQWWRQPAIGTWLC